MRRCTSSAETMQRLRSSRKVVSLPARSQRRRVSALTPMAAAASPRVRFALTSGNIPLATDQKGSELKLSARNQLAGTVKEVRKGAAIANVTVDVGGQRIVSSITVEAVEELGLAEGSQVTVIVKASDVILAAE